MAGVGEAALGAVFEVLIREVGLLIIKGYQFRKQLRKITIKLEALKPFIQEVTRLNVDLDMSQQNNYYLRALEDGTKTVAKLSQDLERKRWWRYPWNTRKLCSLDGDLGSLLQVLQALLGVVVLKNHKVLTNLVAGSPTLAVVARLQPPLSLAASGCCDAPQPPKFDVGLDVPLAELRDAVLSKEQDVVVVVAPPGCGKTTLVQKLCQDDQIKGRFNNILFVKVSRTPDMGFISGAIYEHFGRQVPNFRDEEDARNSLERLLKEIGRVLLVLDDVWLESEAVIEKFRFQIKDYKILVTSRFEFNQFKPVYELKMLSDDDAATLFRHYTKLDVRSDIPKALVKEAVHRCKRCPLVLKVIGLALCGQSPKIWQSELDKLSTRDSSILDFKDLLLCLQSSLEFLGEKHPVLKECFIDLGSFPEDRRIPATALIDIWTELHGVKESVAAANLDYLSMMGMATVVVTRSDIYENDDYYSEHFVTLHDMLRELAIHQQSSGIIKRKFVESLGSNREDFANDNARLLAITTDGQLSSKWSDAQVNETEILVLNFLQKDQTLPDFVERMSKLKVLIVTNYGSFPAELLNSQFLSHLTNLKKIRLERVQIPSFSSIKLDTLCKLSFFMCKVGKAFTSINISEAFPNLEELNIDYCGDLAKLPNGVCDNVKMKKLSVTHCHKLASLPEAIGEMGNLEVLRLRSCIDLVELPPSICELSKLNFLDISHCFSIMNLPEDIGKLGSLRKLNMKGCSRLQDLPPSVLDFDELEEVVCDEEIKNLWEQYFPSDTEIEFTLAKEDFNLNFL